MSTSVSTAPTAPPSQASAPRSTPNALHRGRGGRQQRSEGQRRPRGQDSQRSRRGGPGASGRQHGGEKTSTQIDRTASSKADGKVDSVGAATVGAGASATIPVSLADGATGVDDDAEAEVCFICASPVVHQAVAPCNHRTCHICALRLRALYKTRACAHCRTESAFVIFTDDPTKRYEEFQDADFERTDEGLGIRYEKQEIYDDTILLLRYNCADQDCDIACYGWPDLHRHVRTVHHKVMCDLCTRNKKVFTHEHELYTQAELRKHERFGDDNPGAVDQTGFKGHPECGFCRQRFYGDDELFVHCRDKHERCHLCDRRNGGRSHQYYVNYDSLEAHFRKDHFLCFDQECLDKKFVVFDSEIDLKAHQLESHPNGMSKDVRREARMVNMSTFDFRAPHQEERRGGRSGRGRGRDPNAEPLPASSAQPLRRDELAFQRQMAIHSAQSTTSRSFGGQLSSTSSSNRPPQNPQPAPTNSRPTLADTTAALSSTTLNSAQPAPSNSTQPLDPRSEARRLQHQAVMDRAATLLRKDASKLESFRNQVSAFQKSAIGAGELIEVFFSLFDISGADLGTLIKELAELYENNSKRADLLKAWQDWRAINEDYPSLPGPSGGTAAAPATGAGGRRVLKLKSASAQSGRAAVSRQATGWGSMPAFAAAAASSGNSNPPPNVPFPTLASASGSSGRKAVPSSSAWAGAAGGANSSASSSARPSPAPTRQAMAPPPGTRDAFPELPKAAKPNVHMVGRHRGNVQWNTPGATAKSSAWGTGGSMGVGSTSAAEDWAVNGIAPDNLGSDTGGQAGGKKKGKKGKEVLYKFG